MTLLSHVSIHRINRIAACLQLCAAEWELRRLCKISLQEKSFHLASGSSAKWKSLYEMLPTLQTAGQGTLGLLLLAVVTA